VNAIQIKESIMRLTIHKKSIVVVLCATVFTCKLLAEVECLPPPTTCDGYPKIEGQLEDSTALYESACRDFWSVDLDDTLNICADFIYNAPLNGSVNDSEFQHYWPLFVEASKKYTFLPAGQIDTTDMDYYLSHSWTLCGGATKATISEMHDDSLFCLFTKMERIPHQPNSTIGSGRDVQYSSHHIGARTNHLQRGTVNLQGRELGKGIRAPGIKLYRWRQLTIEKR
jgi:hypothetical protein